MLYKSERQSKTGMVYHSCRGQKLPTDSADCAFATIEHPVRVRIDTGCYKVGFNGSSWSEYQDAVGM